MAEHIHYNSDNCERTIEVHTYPIQDENGRVNRVIETMLDITRRRKAESKRDRTHELLLIEQIKLRNKNIALKEILRKIEDDKILITNRISRNINMLINPLIKTLYSKTEAANHEYLSLLESTLHEITSPYIDRLESQFAARS